MILFRFSDGITPHKLRHTAATLLYKYGRVDIRALQEILGHSTVSSTEFTMTSKTKWKVKSAKP